ncbi:hypothetical protein [Hymenobacter norwichensis]|uniref:hypothetical protein n=1 Tax=Hymenobacter norwichensis TaxID=223903 RepID=UPI0003B3A4C1|nr:hypothetical protein [Hymenobacter norwichensis]
MGLTKSDQEATEKAALTKEQQIEALRENLTKADREKICAQHKISRPTYFRTIKKFDLTSKVMADIVALAQANKIAADQRAKQATSHLKKMV